MPEIPGHDLLRAWQAAVRSLSSSGVGRTELPHQVVATPLQRRAELVQEVLEREPMLQKELQSRALRRLTPLSTCSSRARRHCIAKPKR